MKKINLLMRDWRKGTVQLSSTLEKNGYKKDLVSKYVKSGWLESLGYGAYKLAGDNVDWYGAINALQEQKRLSIHPGGKTALELKGYAHYLSDKQVRIQLFGSYGESLPKWYMKQEWMKITNYIQTNLFGNNVSSCLSDVEIQGIRLKISSPELAAFEMLYLVPQEQSFDEAHKLFEGLTTLRPDLVQNLLEITSSVKVKRLILFMTERCRHDWFDKLNLNKIDLGKGKRVIAKKGILDKKYLITYPKSLE
jgi:hypothetical protein